MAPPTHDSAPRPRPDLLLVGALVLFLVIRGASLLRWDLWYDELFGVGLGYLDWGPLLARAAADQTNPPLFYLLLKGWMGAIPATPLTLRLLPALISAATLVPLLRLLRGMGLPRWTRISVVLLAACSPLLVFYAVEIRAYGLLALLSTAAMAETWALLADETPGRGGIARLALWNALLPLTHYYGWFTIAAEGCAFLLWRRDRWRMAILLFAPAILAFIPWVVAVRGAVRASGAVAPTIAWIVRPSIASLNDFPAFLLTEAWDRLDLLAGPILILGGALALGRRGDGARAASFAALFLVVPVACGFGASFILPRSIWGPRYLIGAAFPALILIALGLSRLSRIARTPLIAGVVLLGASGLWRGDGEKTHWSALVPRLTSPVYTFEAYASLPIRFYAGLEGRHPDVYTFRSLYDVGLDSGWIVARDTIWPGRARGSEALVQWGLIPTDSVVLERHEERIVAWHFVRQRRTDNERPGPTPH